MNGFRRNQQAEVTCRYECPSPWRIVSRLFRRLRDRRRPVLWREENDQKCADGQPASLSSPALDGKDGGGDGEWSGILWAQTEKEGSVSTYFKDRSADAAHVDNPSVKDRLHEVLTNMIPEKVSGNSHRAESHDSKSVEEVEAARSVVVGSILVATEKLVRAHPFDDSMILILKADRETGFQGVIVNKRISWDSLGELEGGSEVLREAHLSLGGPLAMCGLPLVALTRRAVRNKFVEVLPGIYFVDQLGNVGEIEELKSGKAQSVDYRFFLGYASWGWDQLFNEIAEGAWAVSRDDSAKLLEWPSS